MHVKPLMLAIALGLGLPATGDAASGEPPAKVAAADGLRTYIVVFDEAPVASFRGFDKKDPRRPQLAATSPAVTGEARLDASSPAAVAYADYLRDLRRTRLNEASLRLYRALEPTFTYEHALNGMAIELTADEAAVMATLPGVKRVQPDFVRYLQTNTSLDWIKAKTVWAGTGVLGSPLPANRQGEGVIVGVVDSGVRRTHTAFSGAGITNPRGSGNYLGYCATVPAACNNKLIGLWDYVANAAGNTSDAPDVNGHGTHTAGTSAGGPFSTYSGVAPKANLIVYKACPDRSCTGSALIASLNRSILDGVHVVNYSIGGGPFDPYFYLGGAVNDDAEAMLAMREAGIVVAAAAGNDGPDPGTHGRPANSPWVLGVAAASDGTDVLAGFSGRGPVDPLGVLKPDITAPGVNIISAGITNDTAAASLSGTSMATPHVAGAAALVKSVRPTWNANQIISALVLTARDSVKRTAVLPARPHEGGAGMLDVLQAVNAGLYLDVTGTQFRNSNPNTGGNPSSLNLPTLATDNCFETCVLSRSFKLMPGVASGSYSISSSITSGAVLTPSVSSFNISGSGTQVVNFTFDVTNPALINTWVYGSVTLTNTSGDGRANLKLPIAVFVSAFESVAAETAITSQLAAIEPVTSERGAFDINMDGIMALPSARFLTSDLAPVTTTVQAITQDPTNDDPYDDVNQNYYRLVTMPAHPGGVPTIFRVHGSTSAPNGDADLYVGRDTNGNGRPDEFEELCRSTSANSNETCNVDISSQPIPTNYWVMAQNWSGSGPSVTVNSYVASTAPGTAPTSVASGPGKLASSEAFKVRLAYDDPTLVAGESRAGFLVVQSSAGATVATLPYRLTRTGSSFAPFALANGEGRAVRLPAGGVHGKLFFDVPPHATSVQFTTTGATGNLDLYVARVASPVGPTIANSPAPVVFNASATTGSGNETITVSGAGLQPGRWYVTPVNPTGGTVDAVVTATITAQGARPGFLSGQYVNPARDGHGMFVDFAGPIGNPDQWVSVWYTYLEDGTPTWYYAQAASPGANGVWRADLLRVSFDDAAGTAVDVGDVIITETGTNTMSLAFNLDGTSGFEPMQRIGGGSCPQHNGETLDVSGHWYSPSLSGFGYTYLATGGGSPQEVFIPYVYDGQGFPRWLYGQKAYAPATNSFALSWFRGFHPTAPAVALTATAAGTGTRTLATNNVTDMSVASTFGGALAGNWNQNRPVALLSQRKNCQ